MSFLDRIDAEWDVFKAKARAKWYELKDTDWDDIESSIEGRWDRFTDKVKSAYNKTTAEVEEETRELFDEESVS